MRIVMMTNTYAPHRGGVARSVENFAREYRRRGHRVLVVAPEFEGARDEPGVVRVPAVQNFNGSDFSVRLPIFGTLTQTLDDFGADLIHSHHPFLLGDTAHRAAALRDLPLVFTHHTLYEQYTHYVPGDSPRLKRFAIDLSTGYANLCDHVIAPSGSIATLLRERGVTTAIDVVPTGIDVDAFSRGDGARIRRAMNIDPDAFVIGHVGRLAPEKNLEFLSDAVTEYFREHDGVFLVIGDGPVELTSSDRVRCFGPAVGQDLIDCYHAMNIFAFSSKTETQGIVLVEAMAAGLPVVAIDASGSRDVVTKTSGLLVHESVNEFAEAIDAARTRAWSPRERALDFSLAKTGSMALEVYADVVRRGRLKRGVLETEWELWKTAAHAVLAAR